MDLNKSFSIFRLAMRVTALIILKQIVRKDILKRNKWFKRILLELHKLSSILYLLFAPLSTGLLKIVNMYLGYQTEKFSIGKVLRNRQVKESF